MNIIKPSVGMKLKPFKESDLETECLYGETVEILDEILDWYYCKLLTDNYCGWIPKYSLGILNSPTHRVLSKRTFIYTSKNIKSNCIHYLPMGAKVSVKKIGNDWAEVYLLEYNDNVTAFVPKKDLVNIDNKVKDWVSVAEKLLETPYKWGGRDSIGIDCSALVQLSCEAYGKKIPRNTKDQLEISKHVITDFKKLNRGCVIYWNGHVSIMTDNLNCIHANAYHMKTVIEPLNKIMNRMDNKHKILKMFNFNN